MEPLPKLSVIRGAYCSQEMTDRLIKYLQDNRPDLVEELAQQEKRLLPDGRDDLHGKKYGDVIAYLRERVDSSVQVPPTHIGMLDLLYELSRRIRSALNLQEVPILGRPLASSPEGPFPPLTQKSVEIVKNKEHQLSQSLVDNAIQSAYERAPEIFYDFSEQMRRMMRSYEISQSFQRLIKDSLPEGQTDPWNITMGSAYGRLYEMCEMPSYETLKRYFKT